MGKGKQKETHKNARPKVYDCFTFYNEFDILNIRLNILDKHVDYFVIVEGNKTHTNKDKPFYFEENKEKFQNFLHKIKHIKVDDFPCYENSQKDSQNNRWIYENYQRDAILRGLKECKPDDIIIISDCDEIPNPKAIKKYLKTKAKKIWQLNAISTYYYFNLINLKETPMDKIKMGRYENLINPEQYLPIKETFAHSAYGLPTYFRHTKGKRFKNGGWHFSYLMNAEKISQKISSIAEQHINTSKTSSVSNIKKNIAQRKDILGRDGYEFLPVKLDHSFPHYIRKNKEIYSDFIIKDTLTSWSSVVLKNKFKKIFKPVINFFEKQN